MRRSLTTTRRAAHHHAPKRSRSHHCRLTEVADTHGLQDEGEEYDPGSTEPQPCGREQPPPSKTVVDRARPRSTPVPVKSGRASGP